MVKVSSPAKKAGLVAETTPHATQVPSSRAEINSVSIDVPLDQKVVSVFDRNVKK